MKNGICCHFNILSIIIYNNIIPIICTKKLYLDSDVMWKGILSRGKSQSIERSKQKVFCVLHSGRGAQFFRRLVFIIVESSGLEWSAFFVKLKLIVLLLIVGTIRGLQTLDCETALLDTTVYTSLNLLLHDCGSK